MFVIFINEGFVSEFFGFNKESLWWATFTDWIQDSLFENFRCSHLSLLIAWWQAPAATRTHKHRNGSIVVFFAFLQLFLRNQSDFIHTDLRWLVITTLVISSYSLFTWIFRNFYGRSILLNLLLEIKKINELPLGFRPFANHHLSQDIPCHRSQTGQQYFIEQSIDSVVCCWSNS